MKQIIENIGSTTYNEMKVIEMVRDSGDPL